MIFGHVAVSALAYRYLKADFVPVMAAAVVPDVVDKVAHYVFNQGEGSRWMGHTLIVVAVTTVLVYLIRSRVELGTRLSTASSGAWRRRLTAPVRSTNSLDYGFAKR